MSAPTEGSTAARLAARTRALVGSIPPALAILVLIAVGLRLALWLAYSPAIVNLADAGAYVSAAGNELFGDATRTVGYPIFLRAVHAVSAQVEFTIAIQHLIGIVSGLVLYGTVRRLGAPVWAAVVAAAAILLPLDQMVLEHALMNEPLFTLLLVIGLYAAVRALEDPRPIAGRLDSRHAWVAAAAVAIGLSAWVRAVGAPVIALFVLWFALALPGSWRARLANAVACAAAAGAVLLTYFAIHESHTGYFGLTESSGWALYSRVAPFADCSRFEPPEGTRPLCEETPPDQRAGPDFYGQQPDSPARRLFGAPPAGNEELGAFARRTLFAQPLSYLEDVGRDVIRYFQPSFMPQDFSGVGPDLLDVNRRAGDVELALAATFNAYYTDDEYEINRGVDTLAAIQDVLRVHPRLLLLSLLLALAGVVVARGRLRWGLLLLLATALAVMVIPPATVIWSSRYAVPAQGPLVAAAAIGAWALFERTRASRGEPAPS